MNNYPPIYDNLSNTVTIDPTQSQPIIWDCDADTTTITPAVAKCYYTLHKRFMENKWQPLTLNMKFEQHTLEIIPITNLPYIKDIRDVLYYYAKHSEIPIHTSSMVQLAAILVQYKALCIEYRTKLNDMHIAFQNKFSNYTEAQMQADLDILAELKKDHYETSTLPICFDNIDEIIDIWRRCHKWSKKETTKRTEAIHNALYYQNLCQDFIKLTEKEPDWSTWTK